MATIVTSTISLKNIQVDGRFVMIETFTDDSGIQYMQSYMTTVAPNVLYFVNQLNAHKAALQASLNAAGA